MTMMVDLYYCPKGATKAERVTTFKIDADDAIRAFPDDYSLTPPAGKEKNWSPTKKGGRFEGIFRLYKPTEPLFKKSWVLPDIEKAKCGQDFCAMFHICIEVNQ